MSDSGRPEQSLQHKSSAGAYSLAEILSQPDLWKKCIAELQSGDKTRDILKRFENCQEWLFIGCGSSYYIAMTAAATWSELTGMRARAIPASELLLFPKLALNGHAAVAPVLISRSGRTSEVLRAAELLRSRNIATLAISCTSGQALEKLATAAIILPADEQSTVMTRSFTSMLLAIQFLAAVASGRMEAVSALTALPAMAERLLSKLPSRVSDFVNQNAFSDYVCLGQGPYYGLACESALKVTEMSCSYGQVFHTLEFRHGPKSIVNRDTLITFLLSEANNAAEREVLEEIKELGGTTLVVSNHADERTRKAADFLFELSIDLPEYLRLLPFVFTGQLVGLYTGLKKRLDPDNPRNLSRVVELNPEETASKPQHASI